MIYRAENRKEEILGLFLVLIGVVLRIMPHPENFTPVTAIALFSGMVLSPALALTIPLFVMILSDLFLGSHPLFFLTWGSFFAVSLIGCFLRNDAGPKKIFFGTLAGSLLFFIVTNLGVFLFQNMYSKSFSGLIECYVMAVPFFRNSLAGDFFYVALFFIVFSLLKSRSNSIIHQKG